jgi:ABC-2 type transport system ATP-binding protein
MSIEAQDISFRYGHRLALDNISFRLEPGRFNALLGPNGAGKSTLYALLTRLFALQQGEIRIDGLALRQQPRALMQRIGVVFQHSTLDRSLNGGHRRRVEIARALLHEPSVLLLDEASVGLDTASRQAINRHVRELCAGKNLTVLWATHLIEEIEQDDPVLILHKGQILADNIASAICSEHHCPSLAKAFERITGLEEPTACH